MIADETASPAGSKACFVIAPIGEAGSDARRRSDQVLKYIIRPAVTECGYDAPVRADHIAEPGLITTQVIQHLVDDALVVADLSDRNPNVFYELAVRHAIRKPLIQLIRKGDQIPFDVAGMRTIQVDISDLESVEAAQQEIVKQIRSMEAKAGPVDSPISAAVQLQALKQSDDPRERSLADVLNAINGMKRALTALEQKVDDIDLSDWARYVTETVLLRLRSSDERSGSSDLSPDSEVRKLLKEDLKPVVTSDDLRRRMDLLQRRVSQ